MNIDEIKVGGEYRVKPEFVDECGICKNTGFEYIKITKINNGGLHYDAYKNGKAVDHCFNCYKPENLIPIHPTCFEELAEGDVVEWNGNECEVLFTNGKVVIVDDGGTYTFSKREFEEYDLTIPQPEPTEEVTEIAFDEAVEVLAKKYKVDAKNIRIKKED